MFGRRYLVKESQTMSLMEIICKYNNVDYNLARNKTNYNSSGKWREEKEWEAVFGQLQEECKNS